MCNYSLGDLYAYICYNILTLTNVCKRSTIFFLLIFLKISLTFGGQQLPLSTSHVVLCDLDRYTFRHLAWYTFHLPIRQWYTFHPYLAVRRQTPLENWGSSMLFSVE